MRICRFDDDRLGVLVGGEVADVSDALLAIERIQWPYPMGDGLILNWPAIKSSIAKVVAGAPRRLLRDVYLKNPVANPGKIVGIARNRKALASEKREFAAGSQARRDGDPVHMFIKANSALAGPSDGIALRFLDRRNDPEAELSIIIGKAGTDISSERALDYVFGYCIGLDVTLRGSESPSSRKSIDSYAVLGPWIVTKDELPDPDSVQNRLLVNGQLVHDSNTRDFAFDVRTIIAHVSRFYTLYPGDIIMAGTPAMSQPIRPGDVIRAEFDGIGSIEVQVGGHAA